MKPVLPDQDEIPTVRQSTSTQRAPVFQALAEQIGRGLTAAVAQYRVTEQRKSKVLPELDIQGASEARRRGADARRLSVRARRLAACFGAWGSGTTDDQRTNDVLALRALERDAAEHGVKS